MFRKPLSNAMISKLTSPTPSKTYEIGSRIGNNLKGDEIILLAGELGAGKTLLTKGIAASLGIDPDEIVSPTFTLMNQFDFQFKSKKNRREHSRQFIHFDCYRLAREMKNQSDGLVLPEIDEWIDEAIIVVEWAQYLHPSYFSLPKTIWIIFEILSSRKRLIKIKTLLNNFQIK